MRGFGSPLGALGTPRPEDWTFLAAQHLDAKGVASYQHLDAKGVASYQPGAAPREMSTRTLLQANGLPHLERKILADSSQHGDTAPYPLELVRGSPA